MILCDTNILIDFYKGEEVVVSNLQKIGVADIAISVITAGELIYGAINKRELNQIKKDISHLKLIEINPQICSIFIRLLVKYSLSHNLTLPDSIIAATAIHYNLPLYTLNLRDFKYIEELKLFDPASM